MFDFSGESRLKLYTSVLELCFANHYHKFKKMIEEDLTKEEMVNLHLSLNISTDDIY